MAGRPQLLSPARLDAFVTAAAGGGDARRLAADFGLAYQQVIDLRRYHRGRILDLCAANGWPSPFPPPRGPTRRPEWMKPAPEPAERKMRRCLSCGEDFPSTWPGHRVCDACKTSAAWREGCDAAVHETPIGLAGRVAA